MHFCLSAACCGTLLDAHQIAVRRCCKIPLLVGSESQARRSVEIKLRVIRALTENMHLCLLAACCGTHLDAHQIAIWHCCKVPFSCSISEFQARGSVEHKVRVV